MPTNVITQQHLWFPEYKRDVAAGGATVRLLRGWQDWAKGKQPIGTVLKDGQGNTVRVGIRTPQDLFATSSVFGYFHGGGWAFGLLENDAYRITSASYDNYRNAPNGPLNIVYVDKHGNQYTKTIQVGTDIPRWDNLTEVDKTTWKHDRNLRIAREEELARNSQGMDPKTSKEIWKGEYERINRELLADARAITWTPPQRVQFATDQDFKRAQVLHMQQMISIEYWIEVKLGLAIKTPIASIAGGEAIRSILAGLSEDGRAHVLRVARETFGVATDAEAQALLEEAVRAARKDLVVEIAAEGGDVLGAALGRVLAGDNAVKGVLYSSLIGEIGSRLAAQIAGGSTRAELQMPWASADAMNSFSAQLNAKVQQSAIGTLSSLLTAELGQAVGLEGFGAQLFDVAGTTVLNKAISNAAIGANGVFDGFHFERIGEGFGKDAFTANGAGSLLASAIGAFLGAKLGAMVVNPQNQAAGILATLGTAAGTWALTSSTLGVGAAISGHFGSLGSAWFFGNAVLPGVGAFVGFVLGALIGNLFGRKKPNPTASAETNLQVPNAWYEVGQVTANGGGNVALVTSMALAARDTLNRMIEMVVFPEGPRVVSNLNGQATDQKYGHNTSIYVKINNGTPVTFGSADEAVDYGTLTAIRNTKIIGGDILMKRAIARSPAQSLAAFAGDMQIAADYRAYGENSKIINDAITSAYFISTADETAYANHKALVDKIQSAGVGSLLAAELATYNGNKAQFDRLVTAVEAQDLANPWIVTLQRVKELGLDQWTASDVYGGFQGFIDSFRPARAVVGYEDITLTGSGADLIVSVTPNDFNNGFFSVLPSASADGRAVTIQNLLGSGLGYSAWDNSFGMAGNNYGNFSSYGGPLTIDDWGGSAAYSGGDDIALGTAYNDSMHGRLGNDWYDGGGGHDTILGGQGNDVLLGGAGDDALQGNLGNDYLSGGAGNDGHLGGDGNDTFSGKGGSDNMWGENGDDVFIVNADGGGTYDLMDGGAGNDTITYERFGTSVYVDLRTTSYYGDGWSSIENATGGWSSDVVIGNSGDNVLKGGGGGDTLWGQDGWDILEGGAGNDVIHGEGGVDILSYEFSTSGVYVDMTTSEAFGGDAEGDAFDGIEGIRGSRSSDYLRGDGSQNFFAARQGDDWIVATGGGDFIDGGEGLDIIDFSNATYGAAVDLGSSLPVGGYAGAATGGFDSLQMSLTSIEGVRGSAFNDTLYGGGGDQIFVGGAGADVLTGGQGSDTYGFGRGDGQDQINDNGADANALTLSGVTYDELFFGVINEFSSTPGMTVSVLGGGGEVLTVNGNYRFDSYRNVIKSIDIDGMGRIDVGEINRNVNGDDNANSFVGQASHWDWMSGFGGNDTLTGAPSVEDKGGVFVGGRGADSLTGGSGDDQYVMEAGDGADTISDASGNDSLVFGPSVAPEELLYEVSGNDLIIGLRASANGAITAGLASDRVRIVGGGVRYIDDTNGWKSWNTTEYVSVGGASIDVTKLELAWTDYHYESAASGVAGAVAPIVIDLAGDGLDVSKISDTNLIIKDEKGRLFNVGWAGPTDGFLAVDRNKDGRIDRVSEISFLGDLEGAKSDLEGLRAWDSNDDGVLDAKDASFDELLIWTDKNQNGASSAAELQSLKAAGVTSIDLKGASTGRSGPAFESYALNTLSIQRQDGTALTAYDVALAHRLLSSDAFDGVQLQGDGLFGVLTNDPKAEAGRPADARPGQSYEEVAQRAQTDFDRAADRANERALAKWEAIGRNKIAPGRAAMEGAENFGALDRARSPGAAQGRSGAASATLGWSESSNELATPGEDEPPTAPLASAEPLSSPVRLAAEPLDPVDGLPAGQAASPRPGVESAFGSEVDWWRLGHVGLATVGQGLNDADAVAAWSGPTGPAADLANEDVISTARRQLLLRQTMNAFGRPGGGEVLWRASDVERQAELAASPARPVLWRPRDVAA